MEHKNRRAQQGFTLVEMTIVIAIIGLVAGGILTGQYMIRRAELQGTLNDFAKIKSAFQQFGDQYKGLPGDLSDAQDYWGADTATSCPGGTPIAGDRVVKTATCNGNADGMIECNGVRCFEWWRAWQQLANAGLIDGAFTGVEGSAGIYAALPGQNVPSGRVAGTGYTMRYLVPGDQGVAANWYNSNYGHVLHWGRSLGLNGPTYQGFLTPREVAGMDLKADDGKPGTGNFLTHPTGWNVGCATSNTASTAVYSSGKQKTCSVIYIID